jgi:hypothetical protein
MNFLRSIRADLVDKRLLPVVIVLAAVAVLVPVGAVVLSGSGSSAPPVAGPPTVVTPPPGTPSPAAALASVAGPGTPSATRYTKPELDPFRVRAAAAAASGATAAKTAAPAANPTSAVTVKTTGTGAAAKTTPANTTPTNPVTPVKATPTKPVTPVTTTPLPTRPATTNTPVSTPSPKAQLAKLGRRDSYSVDMNVVDATGARSLSGLERLSPLPSATNPLIEYLGVLKSGRAAAFLVNPGVVVQGPGVCLPRTGDCQVLVLKPGQLEALGVRTAGAPIIQASVAVAGWRVVTHHSVAAARQARSAEVKQGRTLVTQSAQPALSDLVYTVAQGAVSIIPNIINALPSTLTKLLGG